MIFYIINSLQAICESKNCLDAGCDSATNDKCAVFTTLDICNLLCSKTCNQCSTLLCGVNYTTSQYYCPQDIVRHSGTCGGEACGDATCKSNTCVIFQQKADCEANCSFGCKTGIPGGDYTKSSYYCSQSNYTQILIVIIVDVLIAIAIIIIIPTVVFCVIKKKQKQQQDKELGTKETLSNASDQYKHEQVLFNKQQSINNEEQNSSAFKQNQINNNMYNQQQISISPPPINNRQQGDNNKQKLQPLSRQSNKSQLKENDQLIKSRGQSRNSNNSINYLDVEDHNQQQYQYQQQQQLLKQQQQQLLLLEQQKQQKLLEEQKQQQLLLEQQQRLIEEQQQQQLLEEQRQQQLLEEQQQKLLEEQRQQQLLEEEEELKQQQQNQIVAQEPLQEVQKPPAPVKKARLIAAKKTTDVQRRTKRLQLNKNEDVEGGHVGYGTRDVDADSIKNSIKQMQEYERNKKNNDF